MPDAHRLGSACVMLALLTSLSPARAQDAAPKAAPEPQPPVNTSPADPPGPDEAPLPAVLRGVPELDAAALESLISKLDDPSLAERDHAMGAIRDLPGVTMLAIEQSLRKETLSAEQRARLSQVGQTLFMNEPRAALGVRFAGMGEDDEGQVQISEPTQGWDSARVLRPWDVIRSIGGLRVRSQAQAKAAIVSYDPENIVELDIIRNGQPGKVRVRLGSYFDLNNGIGLQASVLEAAWRVRSSRVTPASVTPLILEVRDEAWEGDTPPTAGDGGERWMNHPITSEPLRTRMRDIPVANLTASGEARSTGERTADLMADVGAYARPDRPGQIIANRRNAGQIPREVAKMIADSNRRQRAWLDEQISMFRRLAADPNTDPARAEVLRRQAEQLQTVMTQLEAEINEIARENDDR